MQKEYIWLTILVVVILVAMMVCSCGRQQCSCGRQPCSCGRQPCICGRQQFQYLGDSGHRSNTMRPMVNWEQSLYSGHVYNPDTSLDTCLYCDDFSPSNRQCGDFGKHARDVLN